ncbi:hypothetical protein KFE25_004956 [Diacronema lutheri]|uniref:AB hydrolase-1 domain-containing protein n=1 Tax=Diacronema lutheri TaxID=2081491 RepID=A0A8J6CB89_DIALT|nr:hypothetical protein KFE25_004956 [Diacronema lutheri]
MADWFVRRPARWRGLALRLVTECATRAIPVECALLLLWRPPLPLPAAARLLLDTYALAEMLFLALYVMQKARLSRRAALIPRQNHIDRQPLAERAAALDAMLDALGEAIGPDGDRGAEVTGWFLRRGARMHDEVVPEWAELRVDNVADWLAWALWHCERSAVDPDELSVLVRRVEAWVHAGARATRAPLPAGCNTQLFACRLTLDELRCSHRPLMAYVVTHLALGWLNRRNLRARGFAHRQSGRIAFWHRRAEPAVERAGSGGGGAPPPTDAHRRPPIVFLAGIGVGLVSYLALIDALLAAQPGRELILVELEHICLRLSLEHEVESPEQTVLRLRAILAACGVDAAHWVGHSFGTVVISWVLRLAPAAVAPHADARAVASSPAGSIGAIASPVADKTPRTRAAARAAAAAAPYAPAATAARAGAGDAAPPPPTCIAACTFVDPIPFLLFKANVAVRFCYQPARSPLDQLVRYFVAEEIGVSYSLHRHFSWPHNVLDPRLLAGVPTAVVLSELDAFVPSEAVRRHLAHRAPHAAVHMLAGHAHSQFCVSKEGLRAVVDAILETDARVR